MRQQRKILNEQNRQFTIQITESSANGIFWNCLGLGGGSATGGAIVGARKIARISGREVAVGRIASGVANAVVGIGSFIACKRLADNDEARAIYTDRQPN